MLESILNLDLNLKVNRERWGDRTKWEKHDKFGYQWGNGYKQTHGETAALADTFLRPFLPSGRYDLKILELSPGAGRFTAELIRYARSLDLLDMNDACLELTKERFRMIPVPIRTYHNDGQSCAMVEDSDYDLMACFDSMVHMHPIVIEGYVKQLGARLAPGGFLWLDHSGKGANDKGHRTDMTPEKMAALASEAGLEVISQKFRNNQDCISVLARAT